jgi:hypothetical protein
VAPILIVILVLILVGSLPTWPHSAGWGPFPSGVAGLGPGLGYRRARRGRASVPVVRCPIHGIAYDAELEICPECAKTPSTGGTAADRERRRVMREGTPALYCSTCQALRAIADWRERGEAMVIALEPCGHVIHRHAGLEWPIPRAA